MNALNALRIHMRRYPQSEPQDWIKLLYQSEFGPGHFVEAGAVLARLKSEMAALAPREDLPLFEPIGNGYARLHLAAAKKAGLRLETICGLFGYAANHAHGDAEAFQERLDALPALAEAGRREELQTWIAAYKAQGCPPTHHSARYAAAYQPAYRLVPQAAAQFAEVFLRIDALLARQPHVIVSVDGNCASGKSTLSALLAEVYAARLIRVDDFFVPPEQKTPERMATPGGNVDYERFWTAIGAHLHDEAPFAYRPYNCFTGALDAPVTVLPNRLTIVDGVYGQHPILRHLYDLKIVLSIDPARQSARLLKRNGEALHKRFIAEWIPLEELYLTGTHARERADLVYSV